MKLDWDVFKNILEQVEAQEPLSRGVFYNSDEDSPNADKALVEHAMLLVENGFINGEKSDGLHHLTIRCIGLTLVGHAMLESVRNATLWNKIKDSAVRAGIDGLRQIPGLAIKCLSGGLI